MFRLQKAVMLGYVLMVLLAGLVLLAVGSGVMP
jgi:hypothetical protein